MKTMTPHALAVVVLRCIGIGLIALAIAKGVDSMVFFSSTEPEESEMPVAPLPKETVNDEEISMVSYGYATEIHMPELVAYPIALAVLGVMMWVFAGKLANLVTRGMAESVESATDES